MYIKECFLRLVSVRSRDATDFPTDALHLHGMLLSMAPPSAVLETATPLFCCQKWLAWWHAKSSIGALKLLWAGS
eukprot:s855_g12.t1